MSNINDLEIKVKHNEKITNDINEINLFKRTLDNRLMKI